MAQIVTTQPGTTIVVQQTQAVRGWNSGLFSCFDDIGGCKLYLRQAAKSFDRHGD